MVDKKVRNVPTVILAEAMLKLIHRRNMKKSEDLIKKFNVDKNKFKEAMKYLKGRGLVNYQRRCDGNIRLIEVTSEGMEVAEGKRKIVSEFSKTENKIINSQGIIIGDGNTQIININDSFNSIYKEIEKRDSDKKEEIKEAVKAIEDEINKEKVDKSIINKSLDFLKENASWIIPAIELILKVKGI